MVDSTVSHWVAHWAAYLAEKKAAHWAAWLVLKTAVQKVRTRAVRRASSRVG